MQKKSISFVILAAGVGSRMKSTKPKVLHEIANKPMINYILENIVSLKSRILIDKIVIVLGHESENIKKVIKKTFSDISFAFQKQQLGTADAVYSARRLLSRNCDKVVVLCGDAPLVSKSLLKKITQENMSSNLSIVAFNTNNPSGYGRIILNKNNKIEKIIEHKNANEIQKKINLCNSGIFIADKKILLDFVKNVGFDKIKKEKYLTDIVENAKNAKKNVNFIIADQKECIGINDRVDLSMVEKEIQIDIRKKFMKNGVTLIAPETVFFSHDTKIGKDVVIGPNVVFGPNVKVANKVTINAFSHLEGVDIKKGATIGPFARIRPGTLIEEDAKIGNFVEVKNSKIKKGSKVNHLSYIGDADIGKQTNIGAGVITCNYDGKNKNKTIIKDDAFIGSNVSLVAPVKIGKNSLIGAGSVITKDIPNENLAVERNKQVNIKKKKK